MIFLANIGCTSSVDCNELEVCEVELGQCAPMKCREALEKIGGKIELEGNEAKHVSVGATAAFRS